MTGKEQEHSVPISPMTVLVVEKDTDIRSALRSLLQDAGYAVAEAESLHQAAPLLDATREPLVLIVGDAEAVEQADLRFFTAVAANPESKQAHALLTECPERWRLPSLVEVLMRGKSSTVDLPYELAAFLALVANAARQARA